MYTPRRHNSARVITGSSGVSWSKESTEAGTLPSTKTERDINLVSLKVFILGNFEKSILKATGTLTSQRTEKRFVIAHFYSNCSKNFRSLSAYHQVFSGSNRKFLCQQSPFQTGTFREAKATIGLGFLLPEAVLELGKVSQCRDLGRVILS